MPGYKKHLMAGLIFYCSAIFLLSCSNFLSIRSLEHLFFTLLGSLFPDIDIKSRGQTIFYTIIIVLFLFFLLTNNCLALGIFSILSCIPILVKHRSIFHNFWIVSLLVVSFAKIISFLYPVCKTLIYYDAAFFLLGVFSHILLDRGIKKTISF